MLLDVPPRRRPSPKCQSSGPERPGLRQLRPTPRDGGKGLVRAVRQQPLGPRVTTEHELHWFSSWAQPRVPSAQHTDTGPERTPHKHGDHGDGDSRKRTETLAVLPGSQQNMAAGGSLVVWGPGFGRGSTPTRGTSNQSNPQPGTAQEAATEGRPGHGPAAVTEQGHTGRSRGRGRRGKAQS